MRCDGVLLVLVSASAVVIDARALVGVGDPELTSVGLVSAFAVRGGRTSLSGRESLLWSRGMCGRDCRRVGWRQITEVGIMTLARMDEDRDASRRRVWRTAGWLIIAHPVLLFGALPFERTPLLGDSPRAAAAALVNGPMARTFGGGYVESLSFLVFLLAATSLARLLGGRSEVSRWWASSAGAAGAVFVAITLAVGFAAGAAATYDGHHGAPLATVVAVNDVRNFGYFLSVAVLGLFTICVAAAVQVTGTLARWIGYSGYAVGGLLLLSVPAERSGLMDLSGMVWFVWFLALGVAALRRARVKAGAAQVSAAVPA